MYGCKTKYELPLRDPQRAWPTAWCRCCGGEIYREDGLLCPQCRAEERKERRQ
ncbi:MAG: hypothetical protein HFF04_01550 [Oscillospiraceae bacterium]|nr:hypothetical protein [Oscillospiraceae bacterium]